MKKSGKIFQIPNNLSKANMVVLISGNCRLHFWTLMVWWIPDLGSDSWTKLWNNNFHTLDNGPNRPGITERRGISKVRLLEAIFQGADTFWQPHKVEEPKKGAECRWVEETDLWGSGGWAGGSVQGRTQEVKKQIKKSRNLHMVSLNFFAKYQARNTQGHTAWSWAKKGHHIAVSWTNDLTWLGDVWGSTSWWNKQTGYQNIYLLEDLKNTIKHLVFIDIYRTILP